MSNVLNDRRIIEISVDTGFSATKVIVNGIYFEFPSQVVDITGDESSYIGKMQKNFIKAQIIDGRTHVVGKFAVTELSEEKTRIQKAITDEIDNSFRKFKTEDYKIGLMTAIGLAISKYAIYTKVHDIKPCLLKEDGSIDLTGWNIFVAVALPHSAVKDYWGSVKEVLVKEHDYTITTNDGSFRLAFELTENNVMHQSQMICAIVGLFADDNGNEMSECDLFKNLPALIIDGGYVTVGECKLNTQKKTVDGDSNQDYAMYNINSAVAKKLAEKYNRPDIQEFNVDNIITGLVNDDMDFVEVTEDGKTQVVNKEEILKIQAETISETFDKFVDYLNKKYENMVSIRSIVLTGGTGAVYFPYMKKYVQEYKSHLKGKVFLTEYEFQGVKIEPQFAISAGLYKSLHHEVEVALKRAAKEKAKAAEKISNNGRK